MNMKETTETAKLRLLLRERVHPSNKYNTTYHCMKVDSVEWKLVSQLQAHHNHPCDPEEKNVTSSLKEGCWVERLQIVCLLRPSHDREGEKTRGEPRVKDVRITFNYEFIAAASKKFFSFGVRILSVHPETKIL